MADYTVRNIDLSLASQRRELIDRATLIGNVFIVSMPAGAVFSLHFGQHDGIPIPNGGLDLVPCPEENDGLYITNPAQPGVSVTLLIGIAGGVRANA